MVEHGNLFAHATRDLAGITTLGVSEDGWSAARSELTGQLRRAQGALLGYGAQSPSGVAGQLFKEQVEWLEAELTQVALPVWVVGGLPRHPSRWQRHTHRAHFGTPFEVALYASLRRRDASPADPALDCGRLLRAAAPARQNNGADSLAGLPVFGGAPDGLDALNAAPTAAPTRR